MARIERSVLLYCIHYYLFNKADPIQKRLKRKDLAMWMGIGFHIDRTHQGRVIKELQDWGVLIPEGRDWFKIQDLKNSVFA